MMHYTEKTLISIMNTMAKAGIRTSSMLRAQHMLRETFFSVLRDWLERIPLRSNANLTILNRLNVPVEDAAGDVIRQIMRTDRRIAADDNMTYAERLSRALHPQLDMVLACHADNWQKDPQAAIRYLVAIVNNHCLQLKKDSRLQIVQVDPEELRHSDVNAEEGAVKKHSVAATAEEMCENQYLWAGLRCFTGKDYLHDLAILAMKLFGIPCKELVQMLQTGKSYELACQLVKQVSVMLGTDCSGPEALGGFLKAAENFRLPENYLLNAKALTRRLYHATAEESLAKLYVQVKRAIS